MTEEHWQEIIYVALGIPEAVTHKSRVAAELLDRSAAAPEGPRRTRYADARGAILTDLAGCLARGELDRLLVNLEDIGEVARRLADQIGEGSGDEDVRARQAILDHLLPRIRALVKMTDRRQPIALPAALRPHLRTGW